MLWGITVTPVEAGRAGGLDFPWTEMNQMVDMRREVATLGAGCFWCVEAVFDDLRGVDDVVSGYTGGRIANPTYDEVCSGHTGHAEVVRVTFDPDQVSFREILEVFFTVHDPTTLNRQGGDVGTQYRSAVFYHDEEQKRVAGEVIREMDARGLYDDPIVTTLEPAGEFYPAEGYHQEFYARNPNQGYCRAVVAPKLVKFRKEYVSRLKR